MSRAVLPWPRTTPLHSSGPPARAGRHAALPRRHLASLSPGQLRRCRGRHGRRHAVPRRPMRALAPILRAPAPPAHPSHGPATAGGGAPRHRRALPRAGRGVRTRVRSRAGEPGWAGPSTARWDPAVSPV